MRLDVAITNASTPGEPYSVLARPAHYLLEEVAVKHNDEPSCKVVIPTNDPSAAWVSEEHLIKVRYEGRPIFHGPISTPEWDSETHRVTCTCKGWVEEHLQRHNLNQTDVAVGAGVRPNGPGLRAVFDAAILDADFDLLGVPNLGLVHGLDDTDALTDTKLVKYARSDVVWDTGKTLSANFIGPDFHIKLIDEDYNPDGVWVPGCYAQLDTYAWRGQDRTGQVVFQSGFGMTNAQNFKYLPSRDAISNYAVITGSGRKKAIRHHGASELKYGVLETWESSEQDEVTQEMVDAKADSILRAYGESPKFASFDIPPQSAFYAYGGRAAPYRWLTDFNLGDQVQVQARDGHMPPVDTAMRVMEVKLRQLRSNGDLQTAVTVVPHIEDAPGIGDPPDA